MQMSIISYMRNEADIAEMFVRHHAQIAERIMVVLRPSEDGTEAILTKLKREGFPLTILPDASPEFRQADALQEAFAWAMRDTPDWILPLDCDEFLTSDIPLRAALSMLPRDAITLIPWKTYVPTPEDDPQETDVLRRIRHRRSSEVRPFSKALIPSSLFDRAILQTGNHTVLDRTTRQPLPTFPSNALSLAHFPVRSAEQILRKIQTGWSGMQSQASAEQGYHWRDLHARFAHKPPADADLTDIALRYALREDDRTPELLFDPIR